MASFTPDVIFVLETLSKGIFGALVLSCLGVWAKGHKCNNKKIEMDKI